MSGTTVQQTNAKLRQLLGSMLDSGVESLKSLTGQDMTCSWDRIEQTDSATLRASFECQHAFIRGELEGDHSGETVICTMPSADATALSGFMMMTPEDMIEDRRKKRTLEGEELETFSEVSNVLCSSFDSELRRAVSDEGVLRSSGHGVINKDGADHPLPDGPLVALSFEFNIANFPTARGWLMITTATAERWNGGPLGDVSDGGTIGSTSEPPPESAEEIEAAPIRGRLTAYVVDPPILDTLRVSCRRVGLEIDRRARSEVPNPAEHKDGIVLMDVPAGDSRRFEWCKRLKAYRDNVRVALLIHHPSRSRVTQGFLAKADAIMGWPITEQELSEKLDGLMDNTEVVDGE